MKSTAMLTMSLCVLLGGGIGALARFWATAGVDMLAPGVFPMGTFLVNVVGSFLIGLLAILLFAYVPSADVWRGLLISGFLGGFTTFSAFSLETVRLFESGDILRALIYVILSLVCCILATSVGMVLAYLIVKR